MEPGSHETRVRPEYVLKRVGRGVRAVHTRPSRATTTSEMCTSVERLPPSTFSAASASSRLRTATACALRCPRDSNQASQDPASPSTTRWLRVVNGRHVLTRAKISSKVRGRSADCTVSCTRSAVLGWLEAASRFIERYGTRWNAAVVYALRATFALVSDRWLNPRGLISMAWWRTRDPRSGPRSP